MFRKEIKGVPRIMLRQPNANVVMYGSFETVVSKDSLEQAVLVLAGKHQLLNCRIEFGEENKIWYVIDKALTPEINILESRNINGTVIEELKHCFDFENGPLIRFVLLNEAETTLLISCHHSVCDGMSLVYLFNDIVKILSGADIETENTLPVFLEPENLPQKVCNPVSRIIVRFINYRWAKKTIEYSSQLYQEVHTGYWAKYKPQIISFKFSKEETAKIVTHCKQQGISVNTGLVAAFLCAESQLFEHKDYSGKIMITDNLRSHLKKQPGENMGFFVSTVRPTLEYNSKISFWDNARLFQVKIQKLLKNNLFKNQLIGLLSPKILDVMMLNYYERRNDRIGKALIEKAGMYKNSATFVIANLGVIKNDVESDKFRIKTLFGPMVQSNAMEKYIGVLTINNELHFSLCFNEENIDSESILKILKLVPKMFDDGSGN